MSSHDTLRRAHEAFARHAWRDACALLTAEDERTPLSAADLERLATAAYLVGQEDDSVRAWTRAHAEYLKDENAPRAVRCAFWMVLQLLAAGEWARAGGWIATAQRLLDDARLDCAERGLLLVLEARRQAKDRNAQGAYAASCRAVEIGTQFDDPELKAFGRLAQALALTHSGDAPAAARLFDEVMVAVTTADVSPITVGTVYCAVIEGCCELLDVGRAREWTDALTRWCGAQPDLVPFRGHCLVRRAETLRLCGSWSNAFVEAEQACRQLSRPGATPVAAAFYELAEIHRMQGRLAEADEAYRRASELGRSPDPGLALLRLAQGRAEAAATTIRRVLEVPHPRARRAAVLAAAVEILIAAKDLGAAGQAVEELDRMAAGIAVPYARALARHARGALCLAEGQPHAAFDVLRTAWMEWQALEVPYEAARVRVLMGLACRALGDEDAAEMEFSAGRLVFERLDAQPDLVRVDELLAAAPSEAAPRSLSPLTPRELEVIRLVAAGRTNRAIADELAISERTVDRHVSNILTKLDLPSRSAATAYAYQHGLV